MPVKVLLPRKKRIKTKPKKAQGSSLELALLAQVEIYKLPAPEREYRFHSIRRWRFDFAWPDIKLAVECEGGIWTNGAHTRGKHFESDAEKYNTAVLDGWRVLRFSGNMIKSGQAIQIIKGLFKNEINSDLRKFHSNK